MPGAVGPGAFLRERREAKGLTVADVSSATRIAPRLLNALEPGTVREWRSPGRFTVTIGNAGGVVLELDDVTLPPLGKPGEVVRDLTLPADPQS